MFNNRNGIHIRVNQDEFKRKPQEERDWMLFEAVMQVDTHGCRWARGRWTRLYFVGAAAGIFGGFAAVIARWAFF